MRWIKTGKVVKATGESTIMYESVPAGFRIESRKRMIPHANGNANGIGSWAHTTYVLIWPDETETEHWTLRDAKAAAETLPLPPAT